jgi:hypothetical protein
MPELPARLPTTTVGQPVAPHHPSVDERARQMVDAVDAALAQQPTFYRDHTDTPEIGDTPPVPQPGRPPMSQRAVDLNTTLLSSSVVIGMLGVAGTGVLWASSQANPTVIAWMCGCAVGVPAALAVPVLALKALMKGAKQVVEAAPPVHHHTYEGSVYQDQREVHSKNTGVWARTNNEIS